MTCLFALLSYKYFRLNTVFLVGLFLVSVWNGASYYMEVFSKQYEKQLNKLAEEVSSAVAANQRAHDSAGAGAGETTGNGDKHSSVEAEPQKSASAKKDD